ncbi:MAG: FecR domain-containing protein [Spirochaetales bacterium]|nr:FecR domain-containing protein [Spirochaetales bacterium]
MSRITVSICTFLFLLSGMSLFCEELPVAILEYFDDPWEITIYDFTGEVIDDFDFGTELLIGYGIQTENSYAELRLEPNGSILNLYPHTFIKLKELQGVSGTRQNTIVQTKGKLRVIAARVQGNNYSIQTPSMALGVRGTDFIVEVDNREGAAVAVNTGIVDIYNPQTGSSMEIIEGEVAKAKHQILTIMEDEAEEVARITNRFRFRNLNPKDVPHYDFEEYYNDFEYFKDLEREAYLEYFSDDDFFDDYKEYMDRFRDYYSQEMEDFQRVLQEEEDALQESLQEEKDAYKSEMDAFQEFLNRNKR